eukprot:jgi/Tetstr1/438464/TSEL_027019.t1
MPGLTGLRLPRQLGGSTAGCWQATEVLPSASRTARSSMACRAEADEGCDASEAGNDSTSDGKRRPRRRWLAFLSLEGLKAYQPQRGHCERGSERGVGAAWYAMLSRLQTYAALHGHCWVPRKYEPNQQLADWAAKQRRGRRDGTLTAEREWVLDEVGFPWEFDKRSMWHWLARFEELRTYQAEHGHCRVPQRQAGLGRWVSRMRSLGRDSGKLTAEQVALLDGIGFEWERGKGRTPEQTNSAWYAMLSRLQTYAALHGHCWVPRKYEPDQQLADWAARQRVRRRNGTLPAEREWVLDEVGFRWQPDKRPPGHAP